MIEQSSVSKVYMLCNDGNPFLIIKGDAKSFRASGAQEVIGKISVQKTAIETCAAVVFSVKISYSLDGESGEVEMSNVLIPGETKSDEMVQALNVSDKLYIVFGNDETQEIALRSVLLEPELKTWLMQCVSEVKEKNGVEAIDYEKARREAILALA